MIFPSPAEGPSGAEGFLPSLILSLPTFPCLAASHHLLGLPQKSRKSSVMNTYKKCVRNSFRMNTCKTLDLKYLCFQHLREIGGGGLIMACPEGLMRGGEQRPAEGAVPPPPYRAGSDDR